MSSSNSSCRWRSSLTGLWLLLLLNAAAAHDPRPVAVTVTERLPDVFHARLLVPPAVDPTNQPQLAWPGKCHPLQEQADANASSMRCPGGLQGETLALAYPDFKPSLATFFQLIDRAGSTSYAMLPPTEESWTVPRRRGSNGVAAQYVVLGAEHIIGGVDHLLFVLGLLVIAGTIRRILWTITGFTLAHSITLSLSSLGLITAPIVPVEAGIALSILYLATEIGRGRHDTLTYRYPIIVSFVFGLLHGLGFASALGEVGLAPGNVVLSLLFFNIGVELGQIAFIAAVIASMRLFRRLAAADRVATGELLTVRPDWIAMYVVGIPAAYWLIDHLSFLY